MGPYSGSDTVHLSSVENDWCLEHATDRRHEARGTAQKSETSGYGRSGRWFRASNL